MRKNKIYEKAWLKWGKEFQLRMLFEEMAELIQVLCRSERNRFKSLQEARERLIDELVDVEIMLEQTAEMNLIPRKLIEEQKKIKLSRLEKMVNEKD